VKQNHAVLLKSGMTNRRTAGRMRPTTEFRAAREAFRWDQQSWTFAFRRDQQSWTTRFHSMTKKLCGPVTQPYLTKWPPIASRFVTPGLNQSPDCDGHFSCWRTQQRTSG